MGAAAMKRQSGGTKELNLATGKAEIEDRNANSNKAEREQEYAEQQARNSYPCLPFRLAVTSHYRYPLIRNAETRLCSNPRQ